MQVSQYQAFTRSHASPTLTRSHASITHSLVVMLHPHSLIVIVHQHSLISHASPTNNNKMQHNYNA